MASRPHATHLAAAAVGLTFLPWLALAQTAPVPSTPPAANSSPLIRPMPSAPEPQTRTETVELRIESLHASLQITPAQESRWDRVAKVMRDNAADMEKHAIERVNADKGAMTALDSLHSYQHFAEAHVSGLKRLTKAFEELYEKMPAVQRKVADGVFQNFSRDTSSTRS